MTEAGDAGETHFGILDGSQLMDPIDDEKLDLAQAVDFSRVSIVRREPSGVMVQSLPELMSSYSYDDRERSFFIYRNAATKQLRAGATIEGEARIVAVMHEPEAGEVVAGDFHVQPDENDPGLVDDITQLVKRGGEFADIEYFNRFISFGDKIIFIFKHRHITEKERLNASVRLSAIVESDESEQWGQQEYLEAYAGYAEAMGIEIYQMKKGEGVAYRISPNLDMFIEQESPDKPTPPKPFDPSFLKPKTAINPSSKSTSGV
jgi:hypothetical protein